MSSGLMTNLDPIAPVVSTPNSSHVPESVMFPFPDRTLDSILGRKRLVQVIQWNTTDLTGVALGKVEFPAVFMNFSNIMEKLSNFAFIQYDVELEFRVVGSPANSGLLNICYLAGAGKATARNLGWPESHWLNPHELDVGAPAPLIFTIPFTHPNFAASLPFRDMDEHAAMHSVVHVIVEHPLRNMDGTASSVQLEVYARMTNVRTGGDVVSNLNTDSFATAKSLNMDKAEFDRLFREFLKLNPPKSQSDSEAMMRAHTGSAGPGELLDTAGKFVGSILNSAVSEVVGGALLSRPIATTGSKTFYQDPLVGVMGSSRPAHFDVGALKTLYKTDPIPFQRFGDSRPFESINDIASMPGAIARWTVGIGASVGDILGVVPVTPAFNSLSTNSWIIPTPANWVAHFHSFWRGTMKYRLRFTAPQTLPSRIGWVWYPYRSLIPTSSVLSNIGDAISGIVDCTGSGASEFSIPWLTNSPMVPIKLSDEEGADVNNNGYLVFFVVNPPSAVSTTSPNLELSLWAACERDSQWNRATIKFIENSASGYVWQPMSFTSSLENVVADSITLAAPTVVNFAALSPSWDAPVAQSLSDAFAKPFPAPDDTLIVGAPPTTITDFTVTLADIFQRPMSSNPSVNGYFYPNTPLAPASTWVGRRVQPGFGLIFRFWRGSRIFQFQTASTAAIHAYVSDKIYSTANGLAITNALSSDPNAAAITTGMVVPWECISGEYAWNDLTPWIPDDGWQPVYSLEPLFTPSTHNAQKLAFADDFQLGGLAPPPAVFIGQPP